MRDAYLTDLDARIRITLNDLGALGETGFDQHVSAALEHRLEGLCIARELYTRPGEKSREPHEVLNEAREGALVRNDPPRRNEDIHFERNRDHPENLDLVTARVPYTAGGWTSQNATEFSRGDLIALGRALRAAVLSGKTEPQR